MILIQSTVWCPAGHDTRFQRILEHLQQFKEDPRYNVFVVVNECNNHPELQKMSFPANVHFHFEPENKGWAWARNGGRNKAVQDEYEYLIEMDCDIVVTEEDWIDQIIHAFTFAPVFMCRVPEPQNCRKWISPDNITWEMYDEWVGNISCFKVSCLTEIGGYNFIDCPKEWGFADPLMGRQLTKLNFFPMFPAGYPSLPIAQTAPHDPEYHYNTQPKKNQLIGQDVEKFHRLSAEVLSGRNLHYFDPKMGWE